MSILNIFCFKTLKQNNNFTELLLKTCILSLKNDKSEILTLQVSEQRRSIEMRERAHPAQIARPHTKVLRKPALCVITLKHNSMQ